MCNPVAAAIMSIGGSLYSGITGMQAAREQANAARMQSEYQARALEFNAAQARNEAEAVSRQGANEVSDLQKRQRAVAASGRAAAGASGLMVDSGSASDVNAAVEVQAEQDRNLLRENYQRRRFGYINQAAGYEHQAQGARRGGEAYASAAENAGRAGLAGSLLTAAGTVSSKWDDLTGWMKPKKGVKRVADWHDGGNALPY